MRIKENPRLAGRSGKDPEYKIPSLSVLKNIPVGPHAVWIMIT
jgi:hypothetical protein